MPMRAELFSHGILGLGLSDMAVRCIVSIM
jgi:hypothetical protein